MNWWQGLLLGAGAGLIVMPILVYTARIIGNILLKKTIKKMLKRNEFLKPIDAKDFDSEKWKDLIQINKEDLEELNNKIFKSNDK